MKEEKSTRIADRGSRMDMWECAYEAGEEEVRLLEE